MNEKHTRGHNKNTMISKKKKQRWPQTDVENSNYNYILFCLPMNTEWEARVADKHRFIAQETQTGRQVGDKWEASVNSDGPKHPGRETNGRQVWETSPGRKSEKV